MTDDEKELLRLRGRCTRLEADAKLQRRRTDKMRDAVAAYLAGDVSRKRLERVFNDTDYSERVGE